MEAHKSILEQLANNTFPKQIQEKSFALMDIFVELLDCGYVQAMGGNLISGDRSFMNAKITLPGREYLQSLRSPKPVSESAQINIGQISGATIQVGNGNALTVNLTIQDVVEQVAKSDDQEAKSILKELFNNATVATLLGAGVSALLALL